MSKNDVFLCLLPDWTVLRHLSNTRDIKTFKQVKSGTVILTKQGLRWEKLALSVKRFHCTTKDAVTIKTKTKRLVHGGNWQWRLKLVLVSKSQLNSFSEHRSCMSLLNAPCSHLAPLKNWSHQESLLFHCCNYLLSLETSSP